MPAINESRRKKACRTKSLNKLIKSKGLNNITLTDHEVEIFIKAFNMGWNERRKESKKGFAKTVGYVHSEKQRIKKYNDEGD